jgi:hypothetical protein
MIPTPSSRTRRALATGFSAALLAGLALSAPAAAKPTPTVEPLYPDIVEQIPHHLQIQNDKQREWLRFSTTHMNIGAGNLQVRGTDVVTGGCFDDNGEWFDQCTQAKQELLGPDGSVVLTHDAGRTVFHPEHNHWHQSGVAAFTIVKSLDSTAPDNDVATGVKVTFCLIDVIWFDDGKTTGGDKQERPRNYFECNGDLQGISVGWGDQYHQSTPLQELEVTGVPEGVYYLTHEADPFDHWLEGPRADSPGELNNFTWVKFLLSRKGANPEITILDTSGCPSNPAQCGFGGNA